MYIEENGWMLELIFDLSSQALIQMINQLFHTAYSDEEKIWKEWQRANSIGLKVGETNRYEFQVRRLDGCTQIYAEDRGSVFAWGRSVRRSVVHIREPQIIYFGKNHQEEYSTTLEFPDKARVTLPTRIITMENYSPLRLEECGLILFLPFLSNDYAVSLNILAAAGWKLVMLALFYLVVTTYAHCRTKLLVGISLAYALPRFGLFVGQNVAQLLGVGSTADFVRTTAVAFFLLYLILMVIWMVNSHERKRAESQARAADELLGRFAQEQESVRKLRCDALADDHGLTNREKDILYLLAQGRDLAFICETLFLSKNTVKSYQKTIYAKLNVHSKQEIIDLVHGELDGSRR